MGQLLPRAAGTQPGRPRHLALDGHVLFTRQFAKSQCGLFRPGPKSVILGMGDVTDETQGTRDSEQSGHRPQYSSPTAE
jgi:hypothetical protein